MANDAWNPEQYDRFKDERSQPFFDLMALLHPHRKAEMIDLGCGTGELTAKLHRQLGAKSTTGIDSSDEMLKRAAPHARDGLSFSRGDIERWQAPGSFDIVFSNAALQWCGEHPSIFRRIRESLRPGGQLAVQMPMNHDYPTHVLAEEMSREEPWATLLKDEKCESHTKHMLLPEGYAKLLYDLGFKEQKVLLRVYSHLLDSRDGVIEWVKGTLLTRFKACLSESDYQHFLTEFRARLFERLPDDKPFFYPFKRVLIWARG